VSRLTALEAGAFASDRLSPRSFRRLIGAATAACRVAAAGSDIAGYYLLLFRRGSDIARLYSIAVDRRCRGRGIATRLIAHAERTARRRGLRRLRLEVRESNRAAIRLYERLGYRQIGRRTGYYADGADARRYEKCLVVSRKAGEDR
jgi:ribosomal-protein-alanine acetyltransferase